MYLLGIIDEKLAWLKSGTAGYCLVPNQYPSCRLVALTSPDFLLRFSCKFTLFLWQASIRTAWFLIEGKQVTGCRPLS
jgi:hypothetical protein